MACDLNLVDTDTVAWNTPVQGANGLEYSAYLPGHIGATLEPIQGVDNAPRIAAAIDEQLAKNPLEFGSWRNDGSLRTIRGGACLSLCPGEWTLQSPVKLPPGTTLDLWGAHMVQAHAGNMFEITNNQPYNGTDVFTIDSVQIHGHCNAQLHGEDIAGSTAIYGDTMDRCTFRDLVIEGFDLGIRTEQSLYCGFENLHIIGNRFGAKLGSPTDVPGLGHHANNWDTCQFISNTNGHLEVVGSADSSKWDSCTFERSEGTAAYFDTPVSGDRIRGNVFDTCHFEQNKVHVHFNNGINNQVTGGVMEINLLNSPVQTDRLIINRATATTVIGVAFSNNAPAVPVSATTGGATVQALFEQNSLKGDMMVINNFRPFGAGGVAVPYATDENGNLWPESLEPYGTTTTNPSFRILRIQRGGGPNELNI